MIKYILILFTLIILNSCGGGTNTTTTINKQYIVFDNDVLDEDNYITPILASYLSKQNNILLLQTEYNGDLTFRTILSYYDYQGLFGVSTNTNDRPLPKSKTDIAIEQYGYTPYIATDNAYEQLQVFLEQAPDKSIKYLTGGKLIFLSKFLENQYNLDLFKLKVKEIYIGLGCLPNSNNCVDFNLASTSNTKQATKDIFNKLHNKISFNVGVVDYINERVFDYFRTTNDIMTIIYGNTQYKTYGDIKLGDIDSFLPGSNLISFSKIQGNLVFDGDKLLFKETVNGNDYKNVIIENPNTIIKRVIDGTR